MYIIAAILGFSLLIIVHELGHSLGFDDNADHFPTLYTYNRNRARANYLQAPDIYTLKSPL